MAAAKYWASVLLFVGFTPATLFATDQRTGGPDAPDTAVFNTYKEQMYQIRKTEDAERNASLVKESNERNQAQIESEINLRKSKIEVLKAREQRIRTDMDAMKVEILDWQKKYQSVQTEYTTAEQKHTDFLISLEKEKQSLEEAKTKYDTALSRLSGQHEKTIRAITANLSEIQRLKAEALGIESKIDQTQIQVSALQNDEMKTNADISVLKKLIEDRKVERAQSLATLAEEERKYQSVLRNLKVTQAELASAEKSQAETAVRVAAEIRKLNEATFIAQRNRSIAEANRIRVDAEADKLKNYLVMVRKSNMDASSAQQQSDVELLNSHLALEVARTELGQQVALGDRLSPKNNSLSMVNSRSLASVDSAIVIPTVNEKSEANLKIPTELPNKVDQWMVTKNCKIREKPRSASASVGEVSAGTRIPASVGPGSWVKVNSNGKTAYVRAECGNF